MFPSKMFETSEINRMLSKSNESDAVRRYSLFQSPVANRSSSSAESVSPESYFSVPFQFHQDTGRTRSVLSPSPSKLHPYQDVLFEFSPTSESPVPQTCDLRSPHINESPRSHRLPQVSDSRSCYDFVNMDSVQPRPIIGRKILGGTSQVRARERIDSTTPDFWQDNITPPNSHPKNYELFPRTEDFEPFRTPVRSPSIPNMYSSRPSSTISNYTNTRSYNTNYSNFRNPRMDNQVGEGKICTFCRKNGETPMVYSNHRVKEKVDGRFIVTCPILRSHRCQTCGLSGDDAHTITYCPVLRSNNNGRPLTSTTIKLKNTKLKSNGKPRY